MKQYKTMMDFILDDDFCQWVKMGKNDLIQDQKWKKWLESNPQYVEMADEARALVRSVVEEKQHPLSEQKQKELWRKIDGTIINLEPAKKQGNHFLLSYSIAATISLIIIVGIFLLSKPALTITGDSEKTVLAKAALIEYKNLESTPRHVILDDGSRVVLQPNSSLSYPEKFTGRKREVYLSGEGFFLVTKNPDRPFLVHANELVTQVLGTSFNVRAYDKERNVSVIVKTGRVSVYPERTSDDKLQSQTPLAGTFVLPNQQIVFSRAEKRIIKSLVEEPTVLNPTINLEEFRFTDTPIGEVFKKLQDTYGISIIYDEEVLKNCMLNASLGDLSFYDKLRVICKGINAQYEILDAHIIITGPGCK